MTAFEFGKKMAGVAGVQPTHTAPHVSPVGGGKPTSGPNLQPMQQRPTLRPGNVLTGPDLRGLQAQNQQQKLV